MIIHGNHIATGHYRAFHNEKLDVVSAESSNTSFAARTPRDMHMHSSSCTWYQYGRMAHPENLFLFVVYISRWSMAPHVQEHT